MSSLCQAVEDYLSLRHSLGFKLRCPGALLRKFAAFAEAKGAEYVTLSLALEWATRPPAQKPAIWADRMKAVRVFARHQHALDARTEVPPYGLLPYRLLAPGRTFTPRTKLGACWKLQRACGPRREYGPTPTTVCSVFWPYRACASAKPWPCDSRTSIFGREFSLSVRQSLGNRASYLCTPPRLTPCVTMQSSAIRFFPPAAATPSWSPISGALWKSPLSAGPSTNSLAGSVCGRERSTAARVSTTFDIDSPSRR
jgi:hypothetical protein